MLGLYNVTSQWRSFPGWRLRGLGLERGVDALSGTDTAAGGDGNLWLSPYAALWITAA